MSGATALREGATAIAEATPLVGVHANLAPALVAALRDLIVVEKGRTAKIPTKDGKSYSYDFADIGDVVKLTRPALAAHGIVALTPIHAHGDHLACTVVLVHESGEQMSFGPFQFRQGQDAQSTGSAVTYHRRYALIAALGMAAGDDDDGAAAKPRQPEPAFEWTAGAVKAELLNLCEQDKEEAKSIWTDMDGDSLTSFGPSSATVMWSDWHSTPAPGDPS